MDPRNFMHICTYRTKLYRMTAAVSLAACTCALGIPQLAYAKAENAPAAATNQTTGGSTSAPSVATPLAPAPASPETPAQPKDDSLTWTRDDFNISADGKTIGGRKNVYHPETNQTVNEYVDGLSAKGKEKLKKNHHVVIPEGIEFIHECAFTGHAKQAGNGHEHIDGETYIEGVTLPQSLKIIEYGAFGWNKIKGTVTIPKNVISIHSAAFVANEIEKVVFEGVIDGKGKEHDIDAKPYYLAGVGEKAFQGNKISEIVVKGNLGQYKLHPSSDPSKSDSVFDNQNPGTFTIEVGEEYKRPITITQTSGNHSIGVVEGFEENGQPVQIEQSSYFKKNNAGRYVAAKEGTLEGQCLFYDILNNKFRVLGISHFTYEILPKGSLCTVTFNDDDAVVGSVRVRKGKSIAQGAVNGQVMPAAPSKKGYAFKGWNTKSDGTGDAFSATTVVNSDWSVYAVYSKNPEPQPEPKPEPEPAPTPTPTPYPLPAPVPEVPAPTPAPPPVPEHKVPALETPAPKTPATPAEAPVPVVRKHARALPQTGDPMAISAVGELGMMAGIVVASLAVTLRRKRR